MSKKNQIFRNIPDINIINLLLNTFGLDNLDDNRLFTREHMININTVQNINVFRSELEPEKQNLINFCLAMNFYLGCFD